MLAEIQLKISERQPYALNCKESESQGVMAVFLLQMFECASFETFNVFMEIIVDCMRLGEGVGLLPW